VPPPAQAEIVLTFFIGFYETGCYIDSLPAIARRYVSSPTRFWFDASTSIPLSYLDLYYAKVSAFPLFSSACRLDCFSDSTHKE
jgi:hypothetical protein